MSDIEAMWGRIKHLESIGGELEPGRGAAVNVLKAAAAGSELPPVGKNTAMSRVQVVWAFGVPALVEQIALGRLAVETARKCTTTFTRERMAELAGSENPQAACLAALKKDDPDHYEKHRRRKPR